MECCCIRQKGQHNGLITLLIVNYIMSRKKIRLRTILTSLSTGAVLLTACLLLGALMIFQKNNIEESLLQNNIAYARKLADTTDRYLSMAQGELSWSALQIKDLSNRQQLRSETDRLRLQSGFFNSVVVVNNNRVVAATSPESLKLVGTTLTSGASILAITTKKPFISEPFISASGNYVVFLSQPLFTNDGHYLGYIGGSIYLKKHSMLSDILSQHFYPTGSDIRIVSDNGMIIFSHNPALIGTNIELAPSVRKQMKKKGSGKLMLSDYEKAQQGGYASLEKTDWNIFISVTDRAIDDILIQTIIKTLWFILVIIVFVGTLMMFLGVRVASPLEKLANIVRESGNTEDKDRPLESVKGWYFEADQLREAVQKHLHDTVVQVAELTDEAITDPLTGIYNRRGFNKLLAEITSGKALSIIAIDIDHFKNINDHFGHATGDDVLVKLAAMLREVCRRDDSVSRFGGEEFILLLPETTLYDASSIAERIRQRISEANFPSVGHLTVSAGVASLFDCGGDINSLLRRADEALYEAKGAGRNVVIISDLNGFKRKKTC